MTTRRSVHLLSLAVAASLLVACSDESSSDGTTSTAASTSSAPASTSTSSTSTTSTTSTSTTSTTSTSTTVATVDDLALSGAGLGDALFGAGADGVMDYVTAILGAPTSDTGWLAPSQLGPTCPGTQVRSAVWDDLSLFFTDESPAASGTRHFAGWVYGPAFGPAISPVLVTAAGVGVGSPLSLLQATYPSGVYTPDDVFGPTYLVEDHLVAFLSDTSPTAVVTSFVGGHGCGE